MSVIRKVALVGASGNLGSSILSALLKSKSFEVTILTRQTENHNFPQGINVKTVDYSSTPSLIAALIGQDALISAVSAIAIDTQKNMIDAAISAGVQRFVPSEFGSNIHNAAVSAIPIFAPKLAVQKYLEQKSAETPTFSHTTIFNGPLLDWSLTYGMLVDLKGKKAELVDGGDVSFSATRLSTVGQSVVALLTHSKETANKRLFIKDLDVTQNKLIQIAKDLDPSGNWTITDVSSASLEQEAYASLANGQFNVEVFIKFLFRCIYGEGYGGRFDTVDNKALGIEGLDESGLRELINSIPKL